MPQVTRAAWASSLATLIADNSNGDISAADVRSILTDLEDSCTWYDEAQGILSEGAFANGDKTKLDGIEAGATADQSAAEIKTAYESNANTNAFDDAAVAKLAGIEASADVTVAANVEVALEGITYTGVTPGAGDEFLIIDATDGGLKAVDFSNLPGAGGGLSNVSEDLTPQLGGDLDVNGSSIVSASNANIAITPNGTGNVLLGNFTFDADQTVGAGQDNYILRYDNGTGLISLEAESGGAGDMLASTYDPGAISEQLVGLTAAQTLTNKTLTAPALGGTVTGTFTIGGTPTLGADLLPGTNNTHDIGSDAARIAQVHTQQLFLAGTEVTAAAGTPTEDRLTFYDHGTTSMVYADASSPGITITGTQISADVQSVAGLTGAISAANLRTALNVADGADVTGSANVETAIEGITLTAVSGATGDEVLIVDATDGGLKAVLWENLPGSGGGIANVVEDLTPQLGGTLDANGNTIDMGANNITDAAVGNWNTAFGWGDHGVAGYATVTGTETLINKTLTTPTINTPRIAHTYNAQTGTTYTLVAADQSAAVSMNNAAANTLTIPANATTAFPIGTKVEVWRLGSGITTIAGATGVTLQGNGGSVSAGSCDIQTQYGGASLTKIATDTWMVGGDIDAVA